MLEIEGIGSEVVTAFFVAAATAAVLTIFVSAWRLTGRRPLFYDLFLVEILSESGRRIVQVLQLGQEFRPQGSWSDIMARMRTRARSQVSTTEASTESSSSGAFDTNVVIQSPATVMDDSAASIPPPSSSTLWEIEMPVATTSGEGNDASHESHFAAAAAIAVLGRGGFQATSSTMMDIVPDTPAVSAVGVSTIGGEASSVQRSAVGAERHHGVTSIVMPMNISVVRDGPDVSQDEARTQPSVTTSTVADQQRDVVVTPSNEETTEKEPDNEKCDESFAVEAEGDSVIRLKFLDDTQRDARTTMTDTIGKFKSVHFGDAVAAGRVVRLIYQGQLLREDSRTLASYGLCDGCVVHCHISNTPYRQTTSTPQSTETSSTTRNSDNSVSGNSAAASNVAHEAQEIRYPRWAAALLLYTYQFPLLGSPLDAIVRYFFDRNSGSSAQPGIIRRTYQRLHHAVFGSIDDDGMSPLDRAAAAAGRPLPQRICLGDYLLWIFAGQFLAVWGFVYAFPQLCDNTALCLLTVLTMYFFFVVCRSSRSRVVGARRGDHDVGPINLDR